MNHDLAIIFFYVVDSMYNSSRKTHNFFLPILDMRMRGTSHFQAHVVLNLTNGVTFMCVRSLN